MPSGVNDFVTRTICMPCIKKQTSNSSMVSCVTLKLKAHDLSDQNAEGITYQEMEDRFVIVLDPNWNTSEAEALRHDEARGLPCLHLGGPGADPHGPKFQECMKRFEEK